MNRAHQIRVMRALAAVGFPPGRWREVQIHLKTVPEHWFPEHRAEARIQVRLGLPGSKRGKVQWRVWRAFPLDIPNHPKDYDARGIALGEFFAHPCAAALLGQPCRHWRAYFNWHPRRIDPCR